MLLVGEFSTEFVVAVRCDVAVVVAAVVGVAANVVVVPFKGAGEFGFDALLFFLFFECLKHEFRSKCWRRNCVSTSLPTTLIVAGGEVLATFRDEFSTFS